MKKIQGILHTMQLTITHLQKDCTARIRTRCITLNILPNKTYNKANIFPPNITIVNLSKLFQFIIHLCLGIFMSRQN